MRRLMWLAPVAGVLAVAAVLTFRPSPGTAQPGKGGDTAAGPALPIKQAVLFSSGVGYFRREGEVEGSARVDLTFQVRDINDLLKSMVLQDPAGVVSAVSYDSLDPVERTLRSYAVNLTGNPNLAQILTQMKGEKVEAVLQPNAQAQTGAVSGAIVGVEHQKQPSKEGPVDVEVLNLWCADGLRSVKMNELQRLRFLSPQIEAEFRRALDTLALSHDASKKAVSINFAGEGKRGVSVGYVVENPIWKTSYRLVMSKEGKPFLQGWAIVENPSDEDWNAVKMALISGRPVSFQMDLYQPLYVPRPMVEMELFASLRPPTYDGAVTNKPVDERALKTGKAGQGAGVMLGGAMPPGES